MFQPEMPTTEDFGKLMVFENPDPSPDAKARNLHIAIYTATSGRRFVGQAADPQDAAELALNRRRRASRSN